MARSSLLSLALASLALIVSSYVVGAAAQEGWTDGRATFYDDNGQGSCQYGTDVPALYAAWPDVQQGFSDSCGHCFEVACVPKTVTDRYGEALNRNNVCYDPTRTVVVKIIDSCPCYHMNYASNQRWCCGDQQHLDLGREAFRQLAPEEQGVIGLRWREVSCDTQGNPGTGASPAGSADSPQQTPDAGNTNSGQGWFDDAAKSWKTQPGMSWDNLLQKWTNQGSTDNSQPQPQEQQPAQQPSDSGSNSQGWWDDASKSWKNQPGMVWSNLAQKWVNQGSDSNQGQQGFGSGLQGGSWSPGKLLGNLVGGGWGH